MKADSKVTKLQKRSKAANNSRWRLSGAAAHAALAELRARNIQKFRAIGFTSLQMVVDNDAVDPGPA